jgi:hypothetical protein
LLPPTTADVVGQQVGTIPAPIALAHSGSGPLLPAAARALGARHQVWLAAWVPHREASFLEEVEAHAEEAFNPDWVGKDPLEDDAVAAHFVYHDCDQRTLEWALSTRRRFVPVGAYRERVALASEIPSAYIVAIEDRTIPPSGSG